MNAWTRWRTAALGVALIAATNVVALVGVAYNRSGEPESMLTLTQREVGKLNAWGFGHENSGLELGLRWRTAGSDYFGFNYGDDAGEEDAPSWIDPVRLAALGFDLPDMEDAGKRRRYVERQSSRDALVVLEFDGPAYRREVERVRRRADEAQARAAAATNDTELKRRADGARNQLARMEREETRLYVVDAGPDLAPLRAKYPDKTRYAIVHAEIRPTVLERKGKARLSAYVQLATAHIMVPLEFRDTWERGHGLGTKPGLLDVQIAFGKRLEPWIVAVSSHQGSEGPEVH